ncbi:unnamed protein product [Rotaria socialis]|uniref:t-SNARE coiled-coil homology domain-containing protein n=2 Tax=Rotaria socialis TaxID=392032 RepID=A0A817MTX0_9BILA|nr:unnamed protein product [Rotaria socialis]
MSDNWIQNHESCKNYAQEINENINEYNKLPNGSSQRAKKSSTIRTMISELNKDVDKLSKDLTTQSRNGSITQREANRRRTLVDAIKQSKEEIEKSMREGFNNTSSHDRMDPRLAPAVETQSTQGLTNEEMTGVRGNLRKNNDEAIDALHAIVKRQKEIGGAMHNEVERHNEIIDTITDRTGLLDSRVKRQTIMIPSLVHLASRVLGKYFLSIESCRYLPDEIVEKLFDEYLKTISSLSIINENDLIKIINILTDHHSDVFCTSFCYSITNNLNFLTANCHVHLLTRIHLNLAQLDFSYALEKFVYEEKRKILNIIGQMENIEYLRLTYNRLDDEDIRLLTASNRIRSKALCNLHSLHLQGNNLTSRSGRFLKTLASLDNLYISLVSSSEKSAFVKEFDNLCECICSKQNGWEEIINRGWISKIPQLQPSATAADNNFYRKRRRVDNDDSIQLVKLVRSCSTCFRNSTSKSTKKQEKIISNPTGFMDSAQANDLLSCYL